jgi:hypothetical protein
MVKRIGDFDQYWIAQIYHNTKTMAAFVGAVHEAGLDRETCTGIWHCIDAAIDAQPVAPQKESESPTKSPNSIKAEIRAIVIELECTTFEQLNSDMYHNLRSRLRELSAI